jgi:hypothetical protein
LKTLIDFKPVTGNQKTKEVLHCLQEQTAKKLVVFGKVETSLVPLKKRAIDYTLRQFNPARIFIYSFCDKIFNSIPPYMIKYSKTPLILGENFHQHFSLPPITFPWLTTQFHSAILRITYGFIRFQHT